MHVYTSEILVSNFGLHFRVDNDTNFRSFYGHFYCFQESAPIVRKTKVAITDA